jgi:Phage integrase family
VTTEAEPAALPSLAGWEAARARFPARPAVADWAATRAGRDEVWRRLTRPPFTLDNPASQGNRTRGLAVLLDWLESQPGDSWQQRWLASGADAAGPAWKTVSAQWLRGRCQYARWRQGELSIGLRMAISADVVRPSLRWLVAAKGSKNALAISMAQARDAGGFAQLLALCEGPAVTAAVKARTLSRTAIIAAAKGGTVRDITAGDVLELLDTEATTHARSTGDTAVFYRLLRQMGGFDPAAPATLRQLRTMGQRTPDEMIDRYRLACRPVRDLLVDYLRERQPAVDYITLESLARSLGRDFWQDLEHHHPGIDTLQLPPETTDAWKQRRRIKPKTVTAQTGEKTTITVPRLNYRECLTRVRAFYLDLAQWAAEDPARWGPWAVRCPVSAAEINQPKAARHRKSRMDSRTRDRLPVLPILIRAAGQRRNAADALLRAARATPAGQAFTAAGQTLNRSVTPHATTSKIWADDPATGERRDLTLEEDHAFWSWAIVEVLRATGIRIEELLEITHYSLVQYRLPTTGELVPLLQIAPSKTDTERLLVVSPDMADVLSAIISRLRGQGHAGTVPLVPAYDSQERIWLPPSPVLFQRRFGSESRRISAGTVRKMLNAALAEAGLTDPADGGPLRCTPHDFRRIFITDAIMSGLPPHIAQVIAGHRDINVTLGYKAVYPDEAIQAHLAFLARRRALRPTEEYRIPSDAEWAEFLGHFERRKVATGICGRAFGTPCIHEHSCLRCSMHWPDPAQRPRIAEIRGNLLARIAEAEREGWPGEVEGLKVSLAGAEDKLAQIDRRSRTGTPVRLGMPGFPGAAAPPKEL